MISGAGAAFREPVGVDIIMEQHPPGKFGLLIDVLSVSSSAVAGHVEVPETFGAGMYSVRPRDEDLRLNVAEILQSIELAPKTRRSCKEEIDC